MIDRKPRLDFVRPSGEAAEHETRLLLIFGLAKDILIKHHDGIGCNDRCLCPLCLKDALCLPEALKSVTRSAPFLQERICCTLSGNSKIRVFASSGVSASGKEEAGRLPSSRSDG